MRVFKIKVMDQVYEVEVEEVGVQGSPVIKNVQPAITAAPAVKTAPAAAPAPMPAAKPQKAASAGGDPILSPMPGKIISIAVKEGQTVQSGDLLLVLEAMKMENEIFSHVSGIVKAINVTPGAPVNPGDPMVVIG
jgi:glutaconyl-CoA decarboxylase